MQACRVTGCVAVAAPAPKRVSRIALEGICAAHQLFPVDELRTLLKRKAGMVAPLERVSVGIEYERADGTCYGYDHNGRYYDVPSRITKGPDAVDPVEGVVTK